MNEVILELQNLSKYYSSSTNVVMGLNNVSLRFRVGEFVVITGESGSGKSTLSHVLCGVLPFESGEMFFDGEPTSQFDGADRENYRREAVSFISQDYGILPGCSVLENVVSALRISGMAKEQASERALEILAQVELNGLSRRKASQLSSGQKQRLSIARALGKPSRILIADEPTGNLDSENSKQIVKLLAEAAKDRLVIMVTHDYDEVKNDATRHIVLRDGAVIQDSLLMEMSEDVVQKPVEKKTAQKLSAYIASLQLRAKPGWSLLLLLFFTLTAFGVFSFLGSFIVSLDDTSTRIYDNSAFRNGDKTRIIVTRVDGESMDENDFDTIEKIPQVIAIEKYGYLADMNYAYRQDIDYRLRYSSSSKSRDEDRTYSEGVTFENTEIFAKTVPEYSDGRQFLTSGNLPQTLYEVVAVGSEDMIGNSITVYIQNRQKWGVSQYIRLDVTVVGVTSEGQGLYFHEDLGRLMLSSMEQLDRGQPLILAPSYEENMEGKVYVSESVLGSLKSRDNWDGTITLSFNGYVVTLEVVGTHNSSYQYYMVVSDELFRMVVNQNYHNQISVTITDYAFTDRVIEKLQENGYIAISPFQQGSTKQNTTLAAQRMQSLKICMIAFLVCLFLQIFVLKGMFAVQTVNYQLLANIGLLNQTAKRSVVIQHLCLAVCGQVLGVMAILLSSRLGINQIQRVVNYLPVDKCLFLSLIHIMGCLLVAILVCRDLSHKVYPYGNKFRDLPDSEVSL